MAGRRIFVGDVQGCRVELEYLLARLAFRPDRDRLLPVGDLVNRGPDSLGALRLLRDLDAECVLGNHDLHLLRVAEGTRRLGRGDTIEAVLAAPDRESLLEWLASQPLLRDHGDLYQVHAGLHPAWSDPCAVLTGLDPTRTRDPRVTFATRVRSCSAEGVLPEEESREVADDPHARFRPWDAFYDPGRHGGRRVVFGHWAVRGLVETPAVVGLDTGCVWGGALTAWIAEEDRFVAVPAEDPHRSPGGRARAARG